MDELNLEEKNTLKILKKAMNVLKISYESEKKLKKEIEDSLRLEQKIRKELETKISDTEIELRKKSEEIDSLQFNNTRLSKRVENLMDELKNNKNSGNSGSGFLGSLWTGKHKDYIEKIEKQLNLLKEELNSKIEENEQTHIQIFEMKNDYKKVITDLETKKNKYIEINEEQNKLIKDFRFNEEKLKSEMNSLTIQKNELEQEINETIQELNDVKNKFEREKNILINQLKKTTKIIDKKIPFNDENNDLLNIYNQDKFSINLNEQNDLLLRLITTINQVKINLLNSNKVIQNKLKLFNNNTDINGFNLYFYFSEKSQILFEQFFIFSADLLQDFSDLCEMIRKFNVPDLLNSPSTFISLLYDIENNSENLILKFEKFVFHFSSLQSILLKYFEEEKSVVDNTTLISFLNEPLINQLKYLNCILENLKSFLNCLLISNNKRNKENDLKFSNMTIENKFFLLSKIFKNINNLWKSFENILNSIYSKLKYENLAFQANETEENESKEQKNQFKYLFKVKISLTLKNHNNDISNSLQNLMLSVNNFLSIFFQLFKNKFGTDFISKKPTIIFDANKLTAIKHLKKINSFVDESNFGVNYDLSIKNKENLEIALKREDDLKTQIFSLKQALSNSELRIQELSEEFIQVQSESKENEEQLNQYKNEEKNVINEDLLGIKENQENFMIPDYIIDENIAKGVQRLSMKLMDYKGKLSPISDMISDDLKKNEKIILIFEKARSIIINLSIQNEMLGQKILELQNKKNISSSENEEKIKNSNILEKEVNKYKEEIISLKKNYEMQIKMLSEHLVHLQSSKK